MTVRSRVAELKSAAVSGEFASRMPELTRVIGCCAAFALGLLLSLARVFGGCGPFGIGIVSAAGSGVAGIACLIGAAAGYLVTGGVNWGLRYVAACLLVYTAGFAFSRTRARERLWFMPLVASAVTAVTGLLNSYELTGSEIPGIVRMATEVILAGGAAYFFAVALSDERRETEAAELRYGVAVVVLISCCLMSVSALSVMDVISVGRLAALMLVMVIAYRGGSLSGSAAGAALGIAMDIASGLTPFYTMCYAFLGLFSGVFSRHGRLIFALSCVMANAVAVLWTWGGGARLSALYECFAGTVVFLLLPSKLLNQAGALLQQGQVGSGESGLRRYTARRVRDIGGAFRDLYGIVCDNLSGETNDNDVARVFDRAADAVCAKCKNRDECWQLSCMDTLSAMNDATLAMTGRGRLEAGDLPPHFREKCLSLDSFVTAVNTELRNMMYRRQFKNRLSESRVAAYGQYSDIAAILDDVAKELGAEAGPDPLAERRLLRYLRSKDVDAFASVFRDRSGRLRAVVESGRLAPLLKEEDYLDKLSAVLGVRLCRSGADAADRDRKLQLLEAEPLTVSVGIAAMKKQGETVSGDRGTYFKTDQGTLCVILSDGMGSGEAAARDSIAAVKILERFLRAGVRPDMAMKLLNSVVLLRNGEEWGYTTVDLMCVDLFTGETCFYKYGASPSYVRSGKNIRRVRCRSLAAGILAGEASAPDIVRMRLKAGSTALIASDGVLVEKEDTWLRKLLASWDGKDVKQLSRDALQAAVREYGCGDDMTVLSVRIDARA